MSSVNIYGDACRALRDKRMSSVIALSDELIRVGEMRDSGYFMRGIAFEYGGDGVDINLDRAIDSYRQAAYLMPDSITFLYLARAHMKKGGEHHKSALRYIEEAEVARKSPMVDVAYARYYEELPTPDYVKAGSYYLRAAMSGRFAGFFGYSSVSRKLGRKFRALFVDCVRITLGPFLFLILGKKASETLTR